MHTTLRSAGAAHRGRFASHGSTLVAIEAMVLGVAAAERDGSDATLETLNELRAALSGRRIDVDDR